MEVVVIIVLLLLLLFIIMTFVQSIYGYMLGTVSRVGGVTAILWLQYISHDKLYLMVSSSSSLSV
jgi:hypothetical protein